MGGSLFFLLSSSLSLSFIRESLMHRAENIGPLVESERERTKESKTELGGERVRACA